VLTIVFKNVPGLVAFCHVVETYTHANKSARRGTANLIVLRKSVSMIVSHLELVLLMKLVIDEAPIWTRNAITDITVNVNRHVKLACMGEKTLNVLATTMKSVTRIVLGVCVKM
jgi:hypothetical protein